jgi:hypothetical protein
MMLIRMSPSFATIGYRYYIVYACLNAAIAIIVYFFFPETKDLSLEDVDDMFAKSPGARAVVKHKFTIEEVQTETHSVEVDKTEGNVNHFEKIQGV